MRSGRPCRGLITVHRAPATKTASEKRENSNPSTGTSSRAPRAAIGRNHKKAAMAGLHAINARTSPSLSGHLPSVLADDGNAQRLEEDAASPEIRREQPQHRRGDNQQQDDAERDPPAEQPSARELTVTFGSAQEASQLLRCERDLLV